MQSITQWKEWKEAQVFVARGTSAKHEMSTNVWHGKKDNNAG